MPLLSGRCVSRTTGSTRSGNATVELAVVLPFLMLFVLGTVDMGRFGKYQIIAANAAYNGALFASMNPTNAANTSGITSAATADVSSSEAAGTATVATPKTYTDQEGYTAVSITVSIPFNTFWSFAAHAINYGGSYTISSTCSMRVRQD